MVDEHRICGGRNPAVAALHVHATAVGGAENGRHRFPRRPVSGRGGEDSADSAAVVEKRPRGGVPGIARRGHWFWHRKSGVMAMAGSGSSGPITYEVAAACSSDCSDSRTVGIYTLEEDDYARLRRS